MKCAICGGNAKAGRTTVSVDTGDGIVVLRGVPARVCTQCGEDWLPDSSAKKVEKIVQRAKRDKSQIEVVALAP
jgi:YgiT-type zinc finger domain-containing protein